MSSIEWRDEYSVGIPEIDAQHRQLVETIRAIEEAIRTGEATNIVRQSLDELLEYATVHFATEEDLFVRYAYPRSTPHIAEHDLFVMKLNGFMSKLSEGRENVCEEMLAYLVLWFNNHMLTTDQSYAAYLRNLVQD